jgi:Tol biopolymer transport system component
MRGAGLALVLILAACGSSSAPTARASIEASPSPVVSPSTSLKTASLACTSPIPTSGQLALVSLDSLTVAVDLVSNPSQPQRLCLIHNVVNLVPALSPRFVSRSEVSYVASGDPGGIVTLNLGNGTSTTVISWNSFGFMDGTYGWSPNGQSLAYLLERGGDPQTGNGPVELHLMSNRADRLLATLPAVPGRGGSPEDSNLLAFSPDGQYFALVETFTGLGSGEQAPFQVRRADGTLVAAYPSSPADVTTGGALSGKRTMAVWAGTGSTLYFRSTDSPGVERWTPQSQQTMVMPSVQWYSPVASPNGRWIAYVVPDSQGMPHVAFFDQTSGLSSSLTNSGGINPHFVASNLVWYAGVRPCTPEEQQAPPVTRICGGLGLPAFPKTGQEFLFNPLTQQETSTNLGGVGVLDIWPQP